MIIVSQSEFADKFYVNVPTNYYYNMLGEGSGGQKVISRDGMRPIFLDSERSE